MADAMSLTVEITSMLSGTQDQTGSFEPLNLGRVFHELSTQHSNNVFLLNRCALVSATGYSIFQTILATATAADCMQSQLAVELFPCFVSRSRHLDVLLFPLTIGCDWSAFFTAFSWLH